MPFTDGAKAKNKPAAVFWSARLVWVPDDTRIEQRRCFKRVFVEEVGADQAALRLVQLRMWRERVFHFGGARFKNIQQISVATLKILQDLVQLLRSALGIESQHPFNDMIGANLVSRIEIARFSRRLEGPDDDPRRIRPQI